MEIIQEIKRLDLSPNTEAEKHDKPNNCNTIIKTQLLQVQQTLQEANTGLNTLEAKVHTSIKEALEVSLDNLETIHPDRYDELIPHKVDNIKSLATCLAFKQQVDQAYQVATKLRSATDFAHKCKESCHNTWGQIYHRQIGDAIASILLNKDGQINTAIIDEIIYQLNHIRPFVYYVRELPHTQFCIDLLQKIKNDTAFRGMLNSNFKPEGDNNVMRYWVRVTCNLEYDSEVTDTHARKALLSALFMPVFQRNEGYCTAASITIFILQNAPEVAAKELGKLIKLGQLMPLTLNKSYDGPDDDVQPIKTLNTSIIKDQRIPDTLSCLTKSEELTTVDWQCWLQHKYCSQFINPILEQWIYNIMTYGANEKNLNTWIVYLGFIGLGIDPDEPALEHPYGQGLTPITQQVLQAFFKEKEINPTRAQSLVSQFSDLFLGCTHLQLTYSHNTERNHGKAWNFLWYKTTPDRQPAIIQNAHSMTEILTLCALKALHLLFEANSDLLTYKDECIQHVNQMLHSDNFLSSLEKSFNETCNEIAPKKNSKEHPQWNNFFSNEQVQILISTEDIITSYLGLNGCTTEAGYIQRICLDKREDSAEVLVTWLKSQISHIKQGKYHDLRSLPLTCAVNKNGHAITVLIPALENLDIDNDLIKKGQELAQTKKSIIQEVFQSIFEKFPLDRCEDRAFKNKRIAAELSLNFNTPVIPFANSNYPSEDDSLSHILYAIYWDVVYNKPELAEYSPLSQRFEPVEHGLLSSLSETEWELIAHPEIFQALQDEKSRVGPTAIQDDIDRAIEISNRKKANEAMGAE